MNRFLLVENQEIKMRLFGSVQKNVCYRLAKWLTWNRFPNSLKPFIDVRYLWNKINNLRNSSFGLIFRSEVIFNKHYLSVIGLKYSFNNFPLFTKPIEVSKLNYPLFCLKSFFLPSLVRNAPIQSCGIFPIPK